MCLDSFPSYPLQCRNDLDCAHWQHLKSLKKKKVTCVGTRLGDHVCGKLCYLMCPFSVQWYIPSEVGWGSRDYFRSVYRSPCNTSEPKVPRSMSGSFFLFFAPTPAPGYSPPWHTSVLHLRSPRPTYGFDQPAAPSPTGSAEWQKPIMRPGLMIKEERCCLFLKCKNN